MLTTCAAASKHYLASLRAEQDYHTVGRALPDAAIRCDRYLVARIQNAEGFRLSLAPIANINARSFTPIDLVCG